MVSAMTLCSQKVFFGLSADEGGQISLVNDSDVLLTVWQFSDGEDEVDHEMEVKYGIISNVSKS